MVASAYSFTTVAWTLVEISFRAFLNALHGGASKVQ